MNKIRNIFGVGFNDRTRPSNKNGKQAKEYGAWINMLKRCYDENHLNKFPTYRGCHVSDEFKLYSKFYDWCQQQIGFDIPNYQIDKDILIKGNKLYSPDSCVFIPSGLNQFLVNRINHRGESPIGVSFRKANGLYHARVSDGNGHLKHIGYFKNSIDAFDAYKIEKEKIAKELADHYAGTIDERVISALRNINVSIND